MSYLPRLSSTYKEPEVPVEEPEENVSSTTLKPASSLLNEKTHNPQMTLKHYRYIPHAPPVLPGPSVLDEAMENELLRDASRMRRSRSRMEPQVCETVEILPSVETSAVTLLENESTEQVKRASSRKGVKSKTSLGRKRSTKTLKKDSSSNVTVNMCLTSEKPFMTATIEGISRDSNPNSDFPSKHEIDSLKREKTISLVSGDDAHTNEERQAKTETKSENLEVKERGFNNRSVQCTIFGSLSRVSVIPPIINSLLRILAFLLNEINKEEAFGGSLGEKKFPMAQIQLLLGELCSQKVEKDYCFDVTYSDSKRMEKILGDFKKYMRDVYGDKGEYIDKMEDLKRVFIESKSKEMQLAILNEKIHDREEREDDDVANVALKEEDLRNPEITLQNKRLESEQLTAEVEFSCRELKKYQKTIAELDWEIKNVQEQIVSLKKSKSDGLGRKNSVHKFSGEFSAKTSRSKDSDSSSKRKA